VNRKIILSAIAACGALGITSASTGRERAEPAPDPTVVGHYIDRLAAEIPSPSKQAEKDKIKLSKEQAQRIGRMEPVIGAALTNLR